MVHAYQAIMRATLLRNTMHFEFDILTGTTVNTSFYEGRTYFFQGVGSWQNLAVMTIANTYQLFCAICIPTLGTLQILAGCSQVL